MAMAELGRLTPTSLKASLVLDRDDETLIVQNALTAPIYGAFGRAPSATDWDFVVPGSAYVSVPIVGGAGRVEFLAVYPGAIPASDVQAIIWRSSCPWGPFVGAIA